MLMRPAFRSAGGIREVFLLSLWIKDDNVHLLKLDGAVDQAILACSGITVELIRIHGPKFSLSPVFGS